MPISTSIFNSTSISKSTAATSDTTPQHQVQELSLRPFDIKRLANLCGPHNQHLQLIQERLGVGLRNRGHDFQLSGPAEAVQKAAQLLQELYIETAIEEIDLEHIHLQLQTEKNQLLASGVPLSLTLRTPKVKVRPRGENQLQYINSIRAQDINFGIGPAGTGKTYLAVACAVEALTKDEVRRILLVRPAVEAGEKLGFLPGDLAQKIDPYLRPLYDALYEMLGFEQVSRLIEKNVIEVAPLAFMRGRTLNNAFVILDESQNTTREQMKMFLTRIGFGTTAVITGDITQIDLPKGVQSGLVHVMQVLQDVAGIGITHFANQDVVRHPLVQRIVAAYDAAEINQEKDTTHG